jgi:hypothetical protein
MVTLSPTMLRTGANRLVNDSIAWRSMRRWSGSEAR